MDVNVWDAGQVITATPTPAPDATGDAECCSPVLAGAVDPVVAHELARSFKALADPTRVQLLAIVAAQPNAEACVCDLTAPVGLSQPTVSHHLKLLVEAGLLRRQQRGRWAYYSLAEGAMSGLVGSLSLAMKTG